MAEGTVARAFEIVCSGTCKNVEDIKRQLKAENCTGVDEHLAGPTIRKQLVAAMPKNK